MTDTNTQRFQRGSAAVNGRVDNDGLSPDSHTAIWLWTNKALSVSAIAVAMFWPILRRVLCIDVFFKFVLMLWRWNTPGSHAGWTFALHLGVFVGLMLLLTGYRSET